MCRGGRSGRVDAQRRGDWKVEEGGERKKSEKLIRLEKIEEEKDCDDAFAMEEEEGRRRRENDDRRRSGEQRERCG